MPQQESPYYINPYKSGRQYPIQGSVRVGGKYKIPYDAMANNPGLQAMEAYRQAKANRRAQEMEEAEYAAKVAEMQGGYTPELQEKFLAPMGQESGLGDQIIGGLGRMVGVRTDRGFTRPYSAPAGLKTKYERDMEAEQKKNVLAQQIEEMKFQRQLERDTQTQEAAQKGREFTATKSQEGREFTAKEQRAIAELREKGANARHSTPAGGAGGEGGTGNRKVGSTKEQLLADLAIGKKKYEQLTQEDRIILGTSGGKSPEEMALEANDIAKIIINQQVEANAIPREIQKDKALFMEYYKGVAEDVLKMLGELSGMQTAPAPTAPKEGKDTRPPLDEIL